MTREPRGKEFKTLKNPNFPESQLQLCSLNHLKLFRHQFQLFRHQFQHRGIRQEGKAKGKKDRTEVRERKTETSHYSPVILSHKISVCMHHQFNSCTQLYPSAEPELQKTPFLKVSEKSFSLTVTCFNRGRQCKAGIHLPHSSNTGI